jgi:hypothetical protein
MNEQATIDVTRRIVSSLVAGLLVLAGAFAANAQSDPLLSWNDGATKKSITDFVVRVTTQGAAEFMPSSERIATFDNDGTLWAEQPDYFQVVFGFDRVRAMKQRLRCTSQQHTDSRTSRSGTSG